jgi:flavin-dependent dehydrogenase
MWGAPAGDGSYGRQRVRRSLPNTWSAPMVRGVWSGERWWGRSPGSTFQTYADLEGYLWSFPRHDHASVGIATRLGAVAPRDLWQRVERFLAVMCPGAKKEKRWSGLLPMAQDTCLWDTPCAGPGWALLGDAAGHVHPITGEGISNALWSAELLAEAFQISAFGSFPSFWQKEYGPGLAAASAMLSSVGSGKGTYEVIFQLSMMMAFSGLGE